MFICAVVGLICFSSTLSLVSSRSGHFVCCTVNPNIINLNTDIHAGRTFDKEETDVVDGRQGCRSRVRDRPGREAATGRYRRR